MHPNYLGVVHLLGIFGIKRLLGFYLTSRNRHRNMAQEGSDLIASITQRERLVDVFGPESPVSRLILGDLVS